MGNSKDHSKKKKRKSRKEESSADDSSILSSSTSSHHAKKKKHSKKKHHKKKKHKTLSSSGDESLQLNDRLQQKLAARGETLEERQERRAKKRAAQISATFGYTADDNPFNDPNLHEKFTWKKAVEKQGKVVAGNGTNAFSEIEKVRKRRSDREKEMEERERSRAEDNRRKELESYDDWAAKEEAFHLRQQRQRSAIRLVEGRETPIDVLAKNILMFGLTEQEQNNRARVKYQEKYDAMNALESLEVELEDPSSLLKKLTPEELEGLKVDIEAFSRLERDAVAIGESDGVADTIVRYWENLMILVEDEIKSLKKESGIKAGASMEEVSAIFLGQSRQELENMKADIGNKLTDPDPSFDREYWLFVREKLQVHLARLELAEQHSRMLVRQLERLEAKRSQAAVAKSDQREGECTTPSNHEISVKVPHNVDETFGNAEEDLTEEFDLNASSTSKPQGRQLTRKPRYFNRVKTGYDWNKYNQTHYDVDNPPPKTVQGYKFNIFYPELMDPTDTPQFRLEPADSDEFCIIRFTAGPPYEDIAFKIVNRGRSENLFQRVYI